VCSETRWLGRFGGFYVPKPYCWTLYCLSDSRSVTAEVRTWNGGTGAKVKWLQYVIPFLKLFKFVGDIIWLVSWVKMGAVHESGLDISCPGAETSARLLRSCRALPWWPNHRRVIIWLRTRVMAHDIAEWWGDTHAEKHHFLNFIITNAVQLVADRVAPKSWDYFFLRFTFNWVPGEPGFSWDLSLVPLYYVVLSKNLIGRILDRWKHFRNNLKIFGHPICSWLNYSLSHTFGMGWLWLVGSIKL